MHVRLNAFRLEAFAFSVDSEAFAKSKKPVDTAPCGSLVHTGCGRIRRVHKIVEKFWAHVKSCIDAKCVDTHLVDPKPIAFSKCTAQRWMISIQIIKPRHLVARLLIWIIIITDRRGPMKNMVATILCTPRIVHIERPLQRRCRNRATIGLIAAVLRIYIEIVAGMV